MRLFPLVLPSESIVDFYEAVVEGTKAHLFWLFAFYFMANFMFLKQRIHGWESHAKKCYCMTVQDLQQGLDIIICDY